MRVRTLAGWHGRVRPELGKPAASVVTDATLASFEVATYLTPADEGAKAALLALARKIDAWDVIVEWAFEDADEDGGRPRVPQNDNVSISAYLKGCEQLGLTPTGRAALAKLEAATEATVTRARRASSAGQRVKPAGPAKLARVTAMRAGSK